MNKTEWHTHELGRAVMAAGGTQMHVARVMDCCNVVARTTNLSYIGAIKITLECIRRKVSAAEAEAILRHYAKG